MGKKVFLKKYNRKKLEWLHDARWFIFMFVLGFILLRFVVGFSYISGDSMSPTLNDGESVMYLRIHPNYKVGDIVALKVPSGDYYVKRIVALPGDTVDIRRNTVYVNGKVEELDVEEGITKRQKGTVVYPYKVSDGYYFTLGDNRKVSVDSRYYGEVTKGRIKGKIIFKFKGIHGAVVR